MDWTKTWRVINVAMLGVCIMTMWLVGFAGIVIGIMADMIIPIVFGGIVALGGFYTAILFVEVKK